MYFPFYLGSFQTNSSIWNSNFELLLKTKKIKCWVIQLESGGRALNVGMELGISQFQESTHCIESSVKTAR